MFGAKSTKITFIPFENSHFERCQNYSIHVLNIPVILFETGKLTNILQSILFIYTFNMAQFDLIYS